MRLLASLLRLFFSLLYHQFAWTYDLVSWTVSLGRWQSWVQRSIPYLRGRVLEIGFGPGHLQQALNERSLPVFGLDESRQMARQASRRLRQKGFPLRLARGHAQHLPYQDGTFDTLVATFPSDYIYDPHTLHEARRVIAAGGRLVILPMAWITGGRPLERLAAWLFRFTGEAPGQPRPLPAPLRDQFTRAGFQIKSELLSLKGSQVLIIIAEKISLP